MSYDQGREHSTLERADLDIAEQLAFGAKASQLLLGIPVYGRSVRTGEAKTFAELKEGYGARLDAGDMAGEFFYNAGTLLQKKVSLARRRGLAGVFMWELGQDSKEREVLQTVSSAAKRRDCVGGANCEGREEL